MCRTAEAEAPGVAAAAGRRAAVGSFKNWQCHAVHPEVPGGPDCPADDRALNREYLQRDTAGSRRCGAVHYRVRHSKERDERPTAYFARAFSHPAKGYAVTGRVAQVLR